MVENTTLSKAALNIGKLEKQIAELRQTADALQASEKKFRRLIENAHEGIVVIQDDRIVFANARACEFMGYSKDALAERPFIDLVHPDDRNWLNDQYEKMRAGKAAPQDQTCRIIDADGQTHWVQSRSAAMQWNGAPAISSFIVDITDRKHAEQALKESETKLSTLVDQAPAALFLHDMKGRIVDVNQAAVSSYGYTRQQLLGLEVSDIDPDFLERNDRETIWQNLNASKKVTFEGRHLRKDGAIFPVNVSLSLIEIRGKAHIFALAMDMSAFKNAQAALIESERRWKNILVNTPQIGISLNPKAEIVFANDHFLKLTGWKSRDVVGQNWFDMFIPDAVREEVRQVFHRVMGQKDTTGFSTYENEIVTRSGEPRNIAWSNVLTKDARGDISDVTCLGIDLTERKRFEARIRQAQKMESIGILAGGIAHDFNNILTPILGLSELLLEDLPAGSMAHENAREILKAGKRGSDLVKQILAFSRQNKHLKMPVRLQQIIKEALVLIRSTIPANIDIIQDLSPDIGLISADATQLHQIAINLVTNAYHAVAETDGKIFVTLRETALLPDAANAASLAPGRYALLTVADTGSGIDPSIMNKIFEPYFTTKAHGKGTGLGLAVVYGIVRDHGGTITVSSEPGNGARFVVYLPLMGQSVDAMLDAAAEGYTGGTEHILIVDDEEPVVRLQAQMLERLGYRVTCLTNSLDALAVFRADPDAFDMVITDMTMPHLTGDLLAQKLIAINPGLPVILCTGYSERIDAAKAEAIGIKGFLMKPIARADLAQLARKLLDST